MARAHWLGLLLLAGCHSYDPQKGISSLQPPDQLLDYNQFVCGVQPTLIRRCSYLGCHGNPEHALRIYSVGKLRLIEPTTRTERDSPLTADEVELNFQSAAGLVYAATPEERQAGDPTHIPLLQKPLASRFGGAEHHGIAIFPQYPTVTPEVDADWNLLVSWVGGKKQPSPLEPACQQLFTAMHLSPRSL